MTASARLQAQATMGAREVALGQATTALPHSVWAFFANPATADRQRKSVSFFGIRYYNLANLTDMAAAISYPTSWGTFGGGVYRYGDELFNESRLKAGFGNAFHRFRYGATLTYNHVSIGHGYGSAGALGLDVGIAAVLARGFWLAAKATNINRPAYGSADEELPRILSIGLSYRLSHVAEFVSDLVKDVRFPISYRGGVEIAIIDKLKGRVGVTTKPLTFSGGLGYDRDSWGINLVVQKHENPVLGLSPGLDINISW